MSTQPAASLPNEDERLNAAPANLDTDRAFVSVQSLQQWEALKARIRLQVLVSSGLYPLPPRNPLNPRITGRIERDGYSVENVLLETHPGFYLAGNLYRPLGKTGPFPAVLGPHGHFPTGRLTHMAEHPDVRQRSSHKARGITFARQGYVAFLYDMIGYNDTRQVDHRFANDYSYWLWSISVFGLQTWNSIRALDFLESLPEVDRARIAISGESGGGTQTMMLGAIDARLAAAAPLVMVSHSMQGGCLCENAPGLRVDFSNMEIAAAAAPKPQLLVAATGDWTKDTLTVEGPSIRKIYDLYGAGQNFEYTIFDAPHNINQDTREAVYAFFGKHLLGNPDTAALKEHPMEVEADEDLLLFPNDAPLPDDAKTAEELTAYLQDVYSREIEEALPKSLDELNEFKKIYMPLWQATLNVEIPDPEDLLVEEHSRTLHGAVTVERLSIGRKGRGDRVDLVIVYGEDWDGNAQVVVSNGSPADLFRPDGSLGLHASLMLSRKDMVIGIGVRPYDRAEMVQKMPFEQYYTTYNRTPAQQRVQDLVTACVYLRTRPRMLTLSVLGTGLHGIIALLAAPVFQGCIADCEDLYEGLDNMFMDPNFYVPGIRRMGDILTCAALAVPYELILHNLHEDLPAVARLEQLYADLGRPTYFTQTEDDEWVEHCIQNCMPDKHYGHDGLLHDSDKDDDEELD